MLIPYISVAAFCFIYFYWLLPDRFRITFTAITGIATLTFLSPLSTVLYILLSAFVFFCGARVQHKQNKFWFWLATLGTLSPMLFYKLNHLESPIGLSYFTLMLLGFYFDTYRGQIPASVTTPQSFLMFSYFPMMLLGPIERFHRLSKTFYAEKRWDGTRAAEGIFLITLGVFKKFVIADRLSTFVADPDRHYLLFAGFQLWFFLIAAIVQIFCDFSGFIDIVRGFSKILGIELIDNFNQPYFARSIPDTWRRWHISLVDWLRDFLYNPIALKTKNLYLASGVVMFAVAMWHEISWNRFFWATFWTLLFSASVFMRRRHWRLKLPSILLILGVCGAMTISTIFFLPRGFAEFFMISANLFRFHVHQLDGFFESVHFSVSDASIVCVGFGFVVALETLHRRLRERSAVLYQFLVGAVLLLLLTVMVGVGSSQAFIYLRF